jgi:diketogulonate reductase-like aldo/keto reductase
MSNSKGGWGSCLIKNHHIRTSPNYSRIVVLQWAIQRGVGVLPRSSTHTRTQTHATHAHTRNAKKHNKQTHKHTVVLQWAIQRGVGVLPRSAAKKRVVENLVRAYTFPPAINLTPSLHAHTRTHTHTHTHTHQRTLTINEN